ncbi:VOC family protein [Gordonia sp. HY002]|uniref:VOC family protein n=1 Tax=Gordonia zhenghanii TaxID=2911516 RepID=UPI001F29C855|nr:VOC family protein [Gordonia zhenghanii]MCF8568973.1 VOC family protein [Gordonia zhenghanii]
MTETNASAPRLNALSIVCDDLQATLAFYRRVGLPIPVAADDAPHVEADLGGFRVMFDPVSTVRGFDPDWTRPQKGSSPMSLAFECPSPAAVDDVVADLAGLGAQIVRPPFDAPWGQRYATVRDPNGNEVDLYAAGA